MIIQKCFTQHEIYYLFILSYINLNYTYIYNIHMYYTIKYIYLQKVIYNMHLHQL